MTLRAVRALGRSAIGRRDIAAVAGATELVPQFGQRRGRAGKLAMRLFGHAAVAQAAIETGRNVLLVRKVDLLRHLPEVCAMAAEAFFGRYIDHRVLDLLVAAGAAVGLQLQGAVRRQITVTHRTAQTGRHDVRLVHE